MTAKQQSEVLRSIQKASGRLEAANRYIIPKGGISLAYALEDALDQKKVAVAREGSVGFGIDEPVVRVILTARRFNPDMRAVGCIRLNEDIAETVRELLQDVEEYDAEKFPKGISTMEWGIAFLCKEGVPAAVVAQNEPTYGGCIYIFGETPEDVANRILIISERLTL